MIGPVYHVVVWIVDYVNFIILSWNNSGSLLQCNDCHCRAAWRLGCDGMKEGFGSNSVGNDAVEYSGDADIGAEWQCRQPRSKTLFGIVCGCTVNALC